MITGENISVSEDATASSTDRSRKNATGGYDVVAVEAHAFGQPQPALDPARLIAVPVMVHQPRPPCPSKLGRRQASDQRRVLRWNVALVVVSVQRPCLNLAQGQLSAVHPFMERMVVVIALRPDGTQFGLQFVRAQNSTHSTISIPSKATSHPACSTTARSGESSSSTGLLLLI